METSIWHQSVFANFPHNAEAADITVQTLARNIKSLDGYYELRVYVTPPRATPTLAWPHEYFVRRFCPRNEELFTLFEMNLAALLRQFDPGAYLVHLELYKNKPTLASIERIAS